MTFLNDRILSGAFKTFEKTTAAALVLKTQDKMDYSNPSVCPYCKKPMIRSTIRTMAGNIEPVYLCPEDRSVGVVPDNEISDQEFSFTACVSTSPKHVAASRGDLTKILTSGIIEEIDAEIEEKKAVEKTAQFSTNRDEQMNTARDGRWNVKWILAHNASCHTDVLDFLAHDSDPTVRSAVAMNNRTPLATIQMLCNDTSNKVHQLAVVKFKQRSNGS